MCKEVDEPVENHKTKGKRSKRDKTLTETNLSTTFALPEPGKLPNLPPEMIILPVHSTGLAGDPLQIQDKDELVDLDLSELSINLSSQI